MLEDTRLGRSIENLLVHDHLCLIYENQKEQFDAVIPFIRIGLVRGEKCIYIADDNTTGQVLNTMRADGIDVESALGKGALVIANKKETYLKKGYFDPDEMIQFLKVATDSAKKDGFPALRVTWEMPQVLGKYPGNMQLMEYESKLNLFFPGKDCLAICQYNKNRFDPDIIKSVVKRCDGTPNRSRAAGHDCAVALYFCFHQKSKSFIWLKPSFSSLVPCFST